MSNFLKPINNLPVAEAISEGDMILINSGGVAKQIYVSLVGGGGGMTVIYAKNVDDNGSIIRAYKDADYTQEMTYAEGKKAFENGAILQMVEAEMNVSLTVVMAMSLGEDVKAYKVFTAMNFLTGDNEGTAVLFSDTVSE